MPGEVRNILENDVTDVADISFVVHIYCIYCTLLLLGNDGCTETPIVQFSVV